MKKTVRNTLIGVGLLAGSLTAYGQGGESEALRQMYVNVNAGGAFLTGTDIGNRDVDFNLGLRLDAAVGYRIQGPWSVEFETGWVWNSVDKVNGTSVPGSVDDNLYQIPFLVNGVYHFETGNQWKPYVGAGIGGILAILSVDEPGIEDDDSSFAFSAQFKGGLAYAFDEHMLVDFSYKLMYSSDQEWEFGPGKIKSDSLITHCFLASFTYNF